MPVKLNDADEILSVWALLDAKDDDLLALPAKSQ